MLIASCGGGDVGVSNAPIGRTVLLPEPPAAQAPTPPDPMNGTALLSWAPPALYSDGTLLADLAGYRIYHATEAAKLEPVGEVTDPGLVTFEFLGLSRGLHYFAVTAYTRSGLEGSVSATVSKTIP